MVDIKKVIMFFSVGILTFLTVSNANAAFSDPFTNGEFSSPLSTGWTRYETLDGVVSIVNEVGVLGESWNVGRTFLEQDFTLPVGVTGLSFEYQPIFETFGAETFTASLLDPSNNPLVSHNTGSYFFMHDWNDLSDVDDKVFDSSFVTVSDIGSNWHRVTLDLLSLNGLPLDAMLAFDFIPIPGFDDGSIDGQIRIDNVFVQTGPPSVIPAPGAMILVLVGLGNLRLAMRRYVTR